MGVFFSKGLEDGFRQLIVLDALNTDKTVNH